MENRAHALIAGLFVVLLGLATAVTVWWLGQKAQDVRYYLLEARQNVTGLNTHAQVRYRGIRAGRVERIDLDERDSRVILVRISLDARYPLTAGSKAKLNTQGLTGIAYVQIEDDGSDPRPLASTGGDPPRLALKPTLLDTLGAQAGDIATQANLLMLRLGQLLSEDNLGNIARTLDNLETLSLGVNRGMEDLPATLASLRHLLSTENVQKLSAALAHVERASRDSAPLIGEMRETVKAMSRLAGSLDRLAAETGSELKGQTLPRVGELMDELTGNSRRLARLIETLDSHPESLVFGRQAPVPGPGEAGFVVPGQ